MNESTTKDKFYTIVSRGDPSNELDACLKSLPNIEMTLRCLYQEYNQHINLLMLAALHGHDAVVRILLSHASDIRSFVELTGIIDGIDGNQVLNATALWCALDRGYYIVARVLIEVGKASVDHGSKNSLLIDAVINDRLDTIQFLVENNYVDINQTKKKIYPQYNSLMLAAAHGKINIVQYLLDKNALVNYQSQICANTALGCAAIYGHLDIVRLLCLAGASANIKNNNGDSPLMLAFTNNHLQVVNYLLDFKPDEICIDELETIACSLIIPMNDRTIGQEKFEKMKDVIRKSFKLREARNLSKTVMQPIAAYDFQQECQTIEEFEKILFDNERLRVEALLMQERILLPRKAVRLCEALLIHGEKLIEQGKFELCLHLWEHTFHLYQYMNCKTSLHRFVWVFCKMLEMNVFISFQMFLKICRLIFEPSEQNTNNHSIKNALCFVVIAAKIIKKQASTKIERLSIYQWINDLCRQQRTTSYGQTLLHLSVNEYTSRDINYRANEIQRVIRFPNLDATQLLLMCGRNYIDVDAIDIFNGNTPLHIVSRSTKPDAQLIVKLLIDSGAHIDCLNKHDQTPFDCAKNIELKTFLRKQQVPGFLKCLCARNIVKYCLKYELIWRPKTKLNDFIYLHGCIGKQNKIK